MSQHSDTLIYEISKSGRRHVIIITGLLVIIGGWCLFFGEKYTPDNKMVGCFCLVLSIFFLFISRHTWGKSTALTIDSKGLWYCDWGLPIVPWKYIADIYSAGSRIRPLLHIELKDSRQFFASLDDKIQKTINQNPLIKSDYLEVPTSNFQMPVSHITETIREMKLKGSSTHNIL